MYLIYAMLIREKKYYDLVESLKSIGEESRIQEYKYWSIIKRAKQTLLFFEPNPQSLTDQITLNTQQQQKYNDLKISIESVPANCKDAARDHLSKKEWEKIRRNELLRADFKCEICGQIDHKLECHETWDYNEESGNQTLTDLLMLCDSCHNVKHLWQTWIKGNSESFLYAVDNFEKINNLSHDSAILFIEYSIQLLYQRKKIEWGLDISLLEKYDINLPKTIFGYSERKQIRKIKPPSPME